MGLSACLLRTVSSNNTPQCICAACAGGDTVYRPRHQAVSEPVCLCAVRISFGMEATPDLPGCILLVVDLNSA
jgi:hypothetical protein